MEREATLHAAIAERMVPLRAHYFAALRLRMQVVERALLLLVSHEFHQPKDRKALHTEVHKLAGTGTTYGFPRISETAKALESALLGEPAATDQMLLELVADLLHVCHEALATSMTTAGAGDHAPAQVPREPAWRVLVADDDEVVRELLARKLRRVGCMVTCAEDGAQAWHLLQAHAYALVVLDQMMPGHDGMSLLRMMKTHPVAARTPVIFLTARDLSADVLDGLNTGAADYITKPFNSDEVVTRCARLLRPLQGAMRMPT